MMSRFFVCLAFLLCLLSPWALKAQLSAPTIYSEADISLASPAFYETWSCAFQGTDVWTDSIYSSYVWSNGDTTNRIHLNTPQFTSDTLTLTVTDAMGNSASSTVVLESVLTQNQNVLYSMFPNVCSGDVVDLFTWMDGGYYLVWNWGDTIYNVGSCDFANGTDCVMFRSSGGNYSYKRYEIATGCTYQSFSIWSTVVNTPSLPTLSQGNDTLYASGNGPSYQWFDANQNAIAGATNSYYVPTASGNYYCEVFDPGFGLNCSSGLAGPINFTLVGHENTLETDISIYPNPTQDQIKILSREEILSVQVFDLTGREVLILENQSGIVNLASLNQGRYWLKINTASGMKSISVVKQ